jgi:predicted ATPase/class 3 adenylate cyclase
MAPLPSGTLTLLFSDIEGSTSLLNGLGSRWGEALSAQRRILRTAFADHDGHEMGTEGDSFFVVFTTAHEAMAAALEAQHALQAHDWPDGAAVRVRMGLHTGEPQRHEDGYIGIDVHRAARIAATAHGGQIVVSSSTQALLNPEGYQLRDLGWHRLKDIADPEHLFDVVAPGLPTDHAPLSSLGTTANLPRYATELVGRDEELLQLCQAVDAGVRLITLTGTAGTGKTRLAVAVAEAVEGRMPGAIYFVALHNADTAGLLWAGIAEAVNAAGDAEELPDERALRFLADRPVLLILDNLEQIPDADSAISRLLDQAPNVRVLITSRRPLHLVDEFQFPVSPLALPAPGSDPRGSAVDLFVRRAQMVKPSFALTPTNTDAVVALCRRLDGLPLAIELAAARSRLLSPQALLHRIDDWLAETAPVTGRSERQQTLRAAIAWSYNLLDASDQQVFAQLGVFSRRFTLEAISAVLTAAGRDPLDIVAHLVDVSLVEIAEGPDGEPMVFLLQTIRHFARAQLKASGRYHQVRLAHARWCHTIATEIADLLHGPRQMSALDRMQAVEEDIRAALDWSLTPAEEADEERASCGYALLEPMDMYWYRFGYIAEGRAWHERALRLLAGHEVPDSVQVVDALHGHGILAVQQLDLTTGRQALERALAMSHRIGDLDRESREANSLGIAHREAGDVDQARELIEHSLSIARLIADPHREAVALTNVVHLHMDTGQYDAAVDAARRAVVADEARNDPWGVAINQSNLVVALLHAQGPQPALEEFRGVAARAVRLGDVELSIDLIDTSAAIWAALGDDRRAAVLMGAADQHRAAAGLPRAAPDQQHLDRFLRAARDRLPEAEWAAAQNQGSGLTVEQAVEEALSRQPLGAHDNRFAG